MYLTSERLTLHQLARLLKAMTDYSYSHRSVTHVDVLLDAVAREQALTLTDEHRAQVFAAVSVVIPAASVPGWRPGEAVEPAIVITSLDQTDDPLSVALWNAWNRVHTAARQEPAELVLMETGGLLVPDPRDRDLDGLSVAEMLFVVAHDRIDGRVLLPAPVLACGVAAALLAELHLRGLIEIDLRSHRVRADGERARTVPGIAVPVRRALGEIQDGESDVLGGWLVALSSSGPARVRQVLLEGGVVVREVRGRFSKRTCFCPALDVVDSIFRVATRPLAVGRDPTPLCAVLIELAKATGLTVMRYGEWIHVHDNDLGSALAGVPGREQLELLLAVMRAEVTDQLARP